MNIGYLVPEFPSQTHSFFWREINALRAMGGKIHLISTRRPSAGACEHDFAERAASETHYIFPPRWFPAMLALAVRPIQTLKALAYLCSLRESPLKKRLLKIGLIITAADLLAYSRKSNLQHVHVHSCAEAAHVAAICRILGGPEYSLTLHGDLPVYGVDHPSKMARARFVACVTNPLRIQVMEQIGLPSGKVPVLWMGVDTNLFRENGSRIYKRRCLHMVTVARLNAAKGHRHALAAMSLGLARGYDFRYTIVGEGPHRSEIENEILRLGLRNCVDLRGSQSESAVLKLLQQADAFVLPSVGLGEAAPVSVMEAMACGLPVLCSIIGGTPDMITNQVDGLLIRQGDEKSLAEAMIFLADNPEERRHLGQAARDRAVKCFDAQENANRLFIMIQHSA